MNTLIWVLVLLLVGLGVMVLEVFVPSGGILGFVSVVALVAGIATAFLEQGVVAGMAALGVVVFAVPTVLAVAFRWFPETPLGRRVLPPPPDAADLLPDPARRQRARDLVGRRGRAVSELLPWGSVEIDGGLAEAMSESGPIDAGTQVEVIGAQGRAVVVRRVDPRAPDPKPPGQTLSGRQAPSEKPAQGGETALSPTLESFEFDGLEPPAA